MAQNDNERLSIANRVRENLALENVLQPIQARSFVRSLQTSWEVPTIQWDNNESQYQFEDASRLIHSAEVFAQIEGPNSYNALTCFKRAGEMLEWLARAGDQLDSPTPIELLASAAFQLGGMPAMAAGLIGQVESKDDGSRLFSRFLSADFDEVLKLTCEFWGTHSDLVAAGSSEEILKNDDDGVAWYFVVELVRCLGLIADSLRRGNGERLDKALLKLEHLSKFAIRSLAEDLSLLARLLYLVAQGYKEASIYNPILSLSELRPEFGDRLELFARRQFSRGRGILWASQLQGLERLLRTSSFAICTPTGSGKTLVANLAMVKELLLVEQGGEIAPLGLYLVPSRALAGEVEAKLNSELGSEFIVTGLYGGADWGITDYWMNAERPTVLIATVEKADALMRYLGPIIIARLKVMIIDEAHQVVTEDSDYARKQFCEHSSRPVRLESFVSRIFGLKPDVVRIALTAVAGGAASPVSDWMENREDAQPVGTSYRSTRQVIGMLESMPQRRSELRLELMNGNPLSVRGRQDPLYLRLQIPAMPQLPAAMRDSLDRFNQLNTLWTALHLVEGKRRILISIPQQPERTMDWFVSALSLAGWEDAGKFRLPEDGSLRADYEEARAACIDFCGEESFELALLDRGIATNHGQMPQRLRRLMTKLIEQRICPITVATATLTEGVNLPFDIIFLSSLVRGYFDTDANERQEEPLSTAEFRNLSGRAGRPGSAEGMEGMTLVAVPQHPSTTAESKLLTQWRQVRQAQARYDQLVRKLTEEENERRIIAPLGLLLESIYDKAVLLLGFKNENEFLAWIDAVSPAEISDNVGQAGKSETDKLADSIDELDGIIMSAVEELRSTLDGRELARPEAEFFLSQLWQRTFSHVAGFREELLSRMFITRGGGLVANVYPDPDERRRLYQYGFPPFIGRQFEAVAPAIRQVLENCVDYGVAGSDIRLSIFQQLGALIMREGGFGFNAPRSQAGLALLENWHAVLAWWLQGPNPGRPQPKELRDWQRFVLENLEFRLGVAIGAVVAQSWADGAGDPLEVPSLEAWKETTRLPWFAFWAKELLRWGTLDPFVAFSLAQGIVQTRSEARDLRPHFDVWLLEQEEEMTSESFIDPQLFLRWQRGLPQDHQQIDEEQRIECELSGTNGRNAPYSALEIDVNNVITWIDASGYELARSPQRPPWFRASHCRDDFELRIDEGNAHVVRSYSAG